MAKSRETAHDPPPPPVESEEETGDEEEASSEEEEGTESESEGPKSQAPASNANSKKPPSSAPAPKKAEPQSAAKPQTTATPTAAAAAAASSSEEEDSESETDTESPPKKPDPSIKPIASKPMDEPEKGTSSAAAATKKPRSKPTASGSTSPSAGAKRPPPSTPAGGDADAKELKRSKRKPAVENSEKKAATVDEGKKLFARVWSEDDEIAILKGIIDYSARKKTDPFTDLNAFHEFIKNNIDFDGTSKQLQDKIRRLKKKYVNNASKEKNGKERTFSNPHEQKAYDLSKKIWGTKKNGGDEAAAVAGETPKANGTVVRRSRSKGTVPMTPKLERAGDEAMEDKISGSEKHRTVSFAPDGRSVQEWVLEDGMEFMEEEDRVEMEKKWKELRTEETSLSIKKLEFILAAAKKVYNGLKSSGD